MKGEKAKMEETCRCAKDEERLHRVGEIIDQFRQLPGALIPVLHEIQDLYGYLPEEALQIVSRELGMSMAEIYGVATFYSFSRWSPRESISSASAWGRLVTLRARKGCWIA